jgi:hypothetical protein
MLTTTLDRRINGPVDTANGGFACGTFAQYVRGAARVRLHAPPPLGRPLQVVRDGVAVTIHDGSQQVATATPVEPFVAPPPVVPTFAAAEAARSRHPYVDVRHLLSDCVVCGPHRADGLGVTPGPLEEAPDVLASPFVPHPRDAVAGTVRREAVWGALDCPSYPAVLFREFRIALLGELTAHVRRDVSVGERLVVVGWTIDSGPRAHRTATAIVDADQRVVASAHAVWIELQDPTRPAALAGTSSTPANEEQTQ